MRLSLVEYCCKIHCCSYEIREKSLSLDATGSFSWSLSPLSRALFVWSSHKMTTEPSTDLKQAPSQIWMWESAFLQHMFYRCLKGIKHWRTLENNMGGYNNYSLNAHILEEIVVTAFVHMFCQAQGSVFWFTKEGLPQERWIKKIIQHYARRGIEPDFFLLCKACPLSPSLLIGIVSFIVTRSHIKFIVSKYLCPFLHLLFSYCITARVLIG